MATPSRMQRLQAIQANYDRILFLLTTVIAAPTQASIDAAITAIDGAGLARPKVSSSVDGESYQWTEFQQMLLAQMLPLEQAIQRAAGPFVIENKQRA